MIRITARIHKEKTIINAIKSDPQYTDTKCKNRDNYLNFGFTNCKSTTHPIL